MGTIILPVTLGQPPAQIKWLTEFLVVDTPSAYNIILRRPFLVRTKSVLSIYHHVLKCPVGDRVGVIHGDPYIAEKCYDASINPIAHLKHCEETMETEVEDEHLEVLEEEGEKGIPSRRASIAKSSSYTMGRGPHWTFPHVQGTSKVCNHYNGLLYTVGRSQVPRINHGSTNHQFPPTIDCMQVQSSKSNHHGLGNAYRQQEVQEVL
ncbi:hypothetical protein ACOSQ4_027292 [Xanthoceras sorbifolium]